LQRLAQPDACRRTRLAGQFHHATHFGHLVEHGIAIAGTHGKTTTTSLIASLLAEGGLDPTYVIGGLLNSSGSHARLGKGKYLVAEADESDASFLHLQPIMAVLTNIDADHLENYGGDFALLKKNFIEFLHRLPFYGLAVVCMDDKVNREILPSITKPVLTYGVDYEADIFARVIKHEGNKTWFQVSRKNCRDWMEIELNLPGKHNVLNALAAITVAHELGIKEEAMVSALRNFQGIARRCQILGEIAINNSKLLLVDDYAHHPTAIAATLSALRQIYPSSRIWAVVEAHGYQRTKALLEKYNGVFGDADEVIVGPIFKARDAETFGVSEESIVSASKKKNAKVIKSLNAIITTLKKETKKGNIVLVMGAGKSYDWSRRILKSL